MLVISRLNYPGAEALNLLHELAGKDHRVRKVHMDTLSCMTGVTRFLEQPPPRGLFEGDEAVYWSYDKTEDEQILLDPLFWESMDYALTEHPERVIGAWEGIGLVKAFAGFRILKPGEDELIGEGLITERLVGEVLKRAWRQRAVTDRDKDTLVQFVKEMGTRCEYLLRTLTKGWWVRLKMEPRIRILKRQQISIEDWAVNGDKAELGDRNESHAL